MPKGIELIDINAGSDRENGICIQNGLADHVKMSHPGFDYLGINPSYSSIFSCLRRVPFEEQTAILVDFFAYKIKGFPNGEHLGRALAEISNINPFLHLLPNQESDISDRVKELANCAVYRFNLIPATLRVISDRQEALNLCRDKFLWWDKRREAWDSKSTWDPVWEKAKKQAEATGQEHARSLHVACDAAAYGACDTWKVLDSKNCQDHFYRSHCYVLAADRSMGTDLARYAGWTVINELMKQHGYDRGNPYEPLKDSYNLGGWIIGEVEGSDGRNELLVYGPSRPVSPEVLQLPNESLRATGFKALLK